MPRPFEARPPQPTKVFSQSTFSPLHLAACLAGSARAGIMGMRFHHRDTDRARNRSISGTPSAHWQIPSTQGSASNPGLIEQFPTACNVLLGSMNCLCAATECHKLEVKVTLCSLKALKSKCLCASVFYWAAGNLRRSVEERIWWDLIIS